MTAHTMWWMALSAATGRSAARWATLALLLTPLCGCGSEHTSEAAGAAATPADCAATVVQTLGRVVQRVYHEGVSSERTVIAHRYIAASAALRAAVQGGDAAGAQAAARALLATGRLTNLLVSRSGQTLAEAGGPALAPLRGTLLGAGGVPIGSYVTSVWSDAGFLAESRGISESLIALRLGSGSVGGSLELPAGELPANGTLVLARGPAPHGEYRFTSFVGSAFPSGTLRVYVLRSAGSTAPLCGASAADTTLNTLSRIAKRIYAGEAGRRTVPQIRRVQRNRALLEAVARRDPAATATAVGILLHQHIVRMRVYATPPGAHSASGGLLLADVGGPYVLAPVTAPLRLHGRTIGTVVLSIQDDEGYLRLTRRLVGLRVLMYMGERLVKNSLGPSPGTVPASGSYSYRGNSYRVYTVHGRAFPSGPLTIRVLIPIPYT
jgi:hypothetical protein